MYGVALVMIVESGSRFFFQERDMEEVAFRKTFRRWLPWQEK